MTINARALLIVQQSDDQIQQTVRLFQGVTPIRDVSVSYSPGIDQATAAANLASAVKAKLARFAADTSTVACAPGTVLDLSDPVVTPPPSPPAGFAPWLAKWSTYIALKRRFEQGIPSVTQARVDQAKADHEAIYDASFEAFL